MVHLEWDDEANDYRLTIDKTEQSAHMLELGAADPLCMHLVSHLAQFMYAVQITMSNRHSMAHALLRSLLFLYGDQVLDDGAKTMSLKTLMFQHAQRAFADLPTMRTDPDRRTQTPTRRRLEDLFDL